MIVRILNSALEDLDRGRSFYEHQSKGLGIYFLDNLFSDIDSLIHLAGIHHQVFGYYRLLATRFPYAIYYRIEDQRMVIVWRVLDLRQAPSKIRRALE